MLVIPRLAERAEGPPQCNIRHPNIGNAPIPMAKSSSSKGRDFGDGRCRESPHITPHVID